MANQKWLPSGLQGSHTYLSCALVFHEILPGTLTVGKREIYITENHSYKQNYSVQKSSQETHSFQTKDSLRFNLLSKKANFSHLQNNRQIRILEYEKLTSNFFKILLFPTNFVSGTRILLSKCKISIRSFFILTLILNQFSYNIICLNYMLDDSSVLKVFVAQNMF